jgi:SpoVK/Ycf46/Vps4 family AAA+-type ATPase
MIDPALLRPGRLDRLIYVGFPDTVDKRLDILCTCVNNSKLANDASEAMRKIAEKGEDLTGADLQGIITSAQLLAAREVIAVASLGVIVKDVLIAGKHLEEAGVACRASVSHKERARYQAIYSQFWKDRNDRTDDGTATTKIPNKQKTALAYS